MRDAAQADFVPLRLLSIHFPVSSPLLPELSRPLTFPQRILAHYKHATKKSPGAGIQQADLEVLVYIVGFPVSAEFYVEPTWILTRSQVMICFNRLCGQWRE